MGVVPVQGIPEGYATDKSLVPLGKIRRAEPESRPFTSTSQSPSMRPRRRICPVDWLRLRSHQA
jgi:hypothetical protein